MKDVPYRPLSSPKGFTIIELVVVVSIIAILAVIAIPIFNSHQAKAKQSEAKVNLGAIFSAAVIYHGSTSAPQTYAPTAVNQLSGWVPAGSPRYSYWYQDGANALGVGTTITRFIGSSIATNPCDVTVPPSSGGFVVAATPTGFTAGATGNIDGDPVCDHWFINDRRTLQNSTNDVDQ